VETRRIITRSKTGSLTPKHFCDSVTKSIIKTSKTNSDDTVVVINKDGDMTRVTRSRSSACVVNHQVAHYRLGKVVTPQEKCVSLCGLEHVHNRCSQYVHLLDNIPLTKKYFNCVTTHKISGNEYGVLRNEYYLEQCSVYIFISFSLLGTGTGNQSQVLFV